MQIGLPPSSFSVTNNSARNPFGTTTCFCDSSGVSGRCILLCGSACTPQVRLGV